MTIHSGLRSVCALLLALACAMAAASDVEVGVVESVSAEHLILAQKDGTAHIGFIASAAALRSLKTIKKGQEVRAVFGTATDARTKAQIGSLLSIRACAAVDPECAADRSKIERAAAGQLADDAAKRSKQQQCLQAMQDTLDKDPRFGRSLATDPSSDALTAYNKLEGEQRACASRFAGDFHDAYMEACELHHCGDKIAGGCAHLAGRTAHPAFHDKAIAKCTTEARKP